MATKPKASKKKKTDEAVKKVSKKVLSKLKGLAASVTDHELVELMVQSMLKYGTYVIEERAVPDYRDGLKPSQRRILHTLHVLGLRSDGAVTKSSLVVGACSGRFHPHGDMAIYGTMVNMANPVNNKLETFERKLPIHLIAGQGNWGTWSEPPAAPRYTECKLSPYSDQAMLNKAYLHESVTPMVPNYLGKEPEPVVLPSLLPTLLLNGASGIAVGVTCTIPPFKKEGVIKLVKQALGGTPVTAKDCEKHLEIGYSYGAVVLKEGSEFKKLYETGEGSINFECKTERDPKAKKLYIIGLTPDFNFENVSTVKGVVKESGVGYEVRKDDAVKSCLDETGKGQPLRIGITLKDNVPAKDFDAVCDRIIKKYLRKRKAFKDNVTERSLKHVEGEVDTVENKFRSMTIPEIINEWTAWRIDLELKYLNHLKSQLEHQIWRLEVFRKAIAKLDVVFKVLKSKADDLDAALAKALKIPVEEAVVILDAQTRRLSRLSDAKLVEDIKALKVKVKATEKHIKRPADKITADIDAFDMKKW